MIFRTDVLIIGGGLAGLTAADRVIAESALSVTLVALGSGASPYMHGFSWPVGDGDSTDLLYEDTVRSGGQENDPMLVRAMTDGVGDLKNLFASLGLRPDEEDGKIRLVTSLGSSKPRIATIGNDTGPVVMKAMTDRINASGRFTKKTGRLLSLIKENGRVSGAWFLARNGRVFPVFSRVTVLASGGYSGLFAVTTNGRDSGGAGIAAAFSAGASLTDLPKVQFEPCVSVFPPETAGKGLITTMFYEGAVLRNARGERFLESEPGQERIQKDALSYAIEREIRSGRGTEHGGVLFDATAVPAALFDGIYAPYLKRYLTAGIDLRTAPVEVAPAAHTSLGGIRITPDCKTGVPGLLAAGESAGGLHGKNRLGGNGGLAAMVFGRIAGKTAVSEAEGSGRETLEQEEKNPSSAAFSALQEEFGPLLGKNPPEEMLGILIRRQKEAVSKGAGLTAVKEDAEEALQELRAVKKDFEAVLASCGTEIKENQDETDVRLSEQAVRLYQDLQAAELLVKEKAGLAVKPD